MRIDIVTAFPKIFGSVFSESIVKRAVSSGRVRIVIHDLRDYASDKRRTVDDRPFGGGPGMVLMVEPIYKAIESIKLRLKSKSVPIYLLSPQGRIFDQKMAQTMSTKDHLILICGHYEGIDERVIKLLKAKEISVGDYVLSGGEIAAMAITDAVVRLVPGVLGDEKSLETESFSGAHQNAFDYPSYTRPRRFRSLETPKILLTGDHEKIQEWRTAQALAKTKKNRPDLLETR